MDAVGRSNSQAVVVPAATTQDTGSVKGTLGVRIVFEINTQLFAQIAIIHWAVVSEGDPLVCAVG